VGAEGNGASAAQVRPPVSRQREGRKLLRQRWSFVEPHPAEAAELAKAARLPLVLAELLTARGVTEPALKPSPSSTLKSPIFTTRCSCWA
jgi:hypothetical protein